MKFPPENCEPPLVDRVRGAQETELRKTGLFRFPRLVVGLPALLDPLVLHLTIAIGRIHERVHPPGKAAVIASEGAGRKRAPRMTAGRVRTPRMTARRMRTPRVAARDVTARPMAVRLGPTFPNRM